MLRPLFIPVLLIAAVVTFIIAGWRLGTASGEAAVALRIQQAVSSAAAKMDPSQGSVAQTKKAAAKRPRDRTEIQRFIEELRGKIMEQKGDPGRVQFDVSRFVSDELKNLSIEEVETALDLVAEYPQGRDRMLLSMGLLQRWAKDDPASAVAYAQSHHEEAGPFFGVWLGVTFPHWARKDPRAAAAAMTHLLKTDDNEIARLSLGNTVFMGAEKLAEIDLPAALRMAAEVPEWAKDSVRSATAKQVHGAGREAFLKALQAIPEGDEKREWQTTAATALMRTDPAAGAQWLDSLNLPAEAAEKITRGVFAEWTSSDPPEAAAWAMSQLPEEEHPALLKETVEQWANREPNECGRWLSALPPGPRNDPALAAFVERITELDPESARAWAEKIIEPALRRKTLDGISSTGADGAKAHDR